MKKALSAYCIKNSSKYINKLPQWSDDKYTEKVNTRNSAFLQFNVIAGVAKLSLAAMQCGYLMVEDSTAWKPSSNSEKDSKVKDALCYV